MVCRLVRRKSRVQSIVTSEVECMALSEMVFEAIYLCGLVGDLGVV